MNWKLYKILKMETRTLPGGTIEYRFARGKNPVGVRFPFFALNYFLMVETRGIEPLSEMECSKHLRA